ncbi:MAG: DUF1294 domain-containing protein [Lachnospiraceae bacterium]|nr:DUF1294 domain-containing protein [Lachnospiraceae bacterium]
MTLDLSTVQAIIGIYLLCVNLLGLIYFFIDKQKAKRQSWRTPEATLFTIAIFGGSIGCLLGMYLFHHKTRKRAFYIGMPVILTVQILIVLAAVFMIPIDFSIM